MSHPTFYRSVQVDGLSICKRVQKQLMWVEAMALFWLIGSFDAIAIELTRRSPAATHARRHRSYGAPDPNQ